MKVDNKKDIVLLLLYSQGATGEVNEPVDGVTRLQKLLFLLDKEYDIRKLVLKYFDFEAFQYGPFTEEIYSIIDALINYGLVTKEKQCKVSPEELAEREFTSDYSYEGEEIDETQQVSEPSVESFRLTKKGLEIAQKLADSLSEEDRKKFIDIKKRFNQLSLVQLINYVYKNYPESAKYSKYRY